MTADTIREKSAAFMESANRLPRILSLTEETVYLLALLEESDEPELVERLAEVEKVLAAKLDRASWTVRDLERLAAMRKDAADELYDAAKRMSATADRIKALMLDHMKATGKERVDTERYTVTIRQNPPRVDILEEQMVPQRFKEIRSTVHIDKRAILQAATKDGEVVPGVSIARGESLRIS